MLHRSLSQAGCLGCFKGGGAEAGADAEAEAGARGELFGGVLALVADDMGRGGTERMDPEGFEVEDDAGDRAQPGAGLLDLVVGDLADTDTLGGAAGGVGGAIDLFLREPELAEGAGESCPVLHEAAVEAQHAARVPS